MAHESVSLSTIPTFTHSYSPASTKASLLNTTVSPNSTVQQLSRVPMTPSKKTNQIPRRLTFRNSTISPKEVIMSPSKSQHMNGGTLNRSRIKQQFIRQVQLTPKSSRIKHKDRLLAIYRIRNQRLAKRKCNDSLVAKESEINAIINACSKYLDQEALAFFLVIYVCAILQKIVDVSLMK